MSTHGYGRLTPLQDARSGPGRAFVLAVILGVIGVLLIPVTFFAVYEFNGRYCNDANIRAVSDSWLALAHDVRPAALTTFPEPGCDDDDPTPSVSQEVPVPRGMTAQSSLEAYLVALEHLGWVQHAAYAVGSAPTDADGSIVANLCATLTRPDRPVLTIYWSASTQRPARYEVEMTADRAGRC